MVGISSTPAPEPAPPPGDAVVVLPISRTPVVDAVVTVMKSPVGAHVGLLHVADDDGARSHLHMAWHFRLKNEPAPASEAFWVEPRFDDLELADVGTSARLIARRHEDGRVPYGFPLADARFDTEGSLELNQSYGLTCATFVILIFAHAGITLLDAATWDRDRSDARKREDLAAHTFLVDELRKNPESLEHAELVAANVTCTRIRAEEVAAASGMTVPPVAFARAEPQGRRMLQIVQAPPASVVP